MTTIGWIFILVGFLIMRQSVKGRSLNQIPGDIGDILRGAATSLSSPSSGSEIVKEVLSRVGTTLTFGNITDATIVTGGTTTGISESGTMANSVVTGLLVLSQMQKLGSVNKYELGATGPNAYDCSGLVWAAMRSIKYTGPKFTTYTFVAQMGLGIAKVTDAPIKGDIVLWVSHMGSMDSGTTMYSALNPREGIKSSPLSYGPKGEPAPTFWRFTKGFG